MEEMKDDPELKEVMEDIEKNGQGAMMKYMQVGVGVGAGGRLGAPQAGPGVRRRWREGMGCKAEKLAGWRGQEVEVDQPDGPHPLGGEIGELARDGGGPLPAARGDQLHHAGAAGRRRPQRRPQFGHFGGQIHRSNRFGRDAMRVLYNRASPRPT